MNDKVQVYSITDEYMRSYYVKTLGNELIENVIYFLCIYPILVAINPEINKNGLILFTNMLTVMPILLMTYFRAKIKKMRDFVLVIIGLLILSELVTFFILRQYIFLLVYFIAAVNCIRESRITRRVKFNKFNLIIVELLLIPQIISAAVFNLNNVQILICIIAIVIMLISIAYICKVRNVRLSMDNEKNKSFSKRDNTIFILGIIILIIMVIFILYWLGIFNAAHNSTKLISNTLNDTIKGSFNTGRSEMERLVRPNIFKDLFGVDSASNLDETFFKISSTILNIIVAVISLCIGYLVINRVLIYVKNLLNTDKVTFVYNTNEENDIKKKIDEIKQVISKSIFLNDKEKIRKLYKKKILKYKKRNININNYFSTNEIQKEVLRKTNDNIREITMIYEKARYSNELITNEDIEILKK